MKTVLTRDFLALILSVVVVALLPALPWAVENPWLCWPLLYVLGAAGGSIYTLSIVACGERFRGAAFVSASSSGPLGASRASAARSLPVR